MNERQLRYLKVIAEERSIHKASSLLKKNPSTLTRGLKNLEEELGVQIFLRTSTGLSNTPEGSQILVFAEEILQMFEGLSRWCFGTQGKAQSHEWTEQELRYLLMIREQQNISRAAKELYMAQPSLSQMLMELEEELGQKIFLRTKEGVMETNFGREFLDQLELIWDRYRQIRKELEEFQQMKKGTLTFGIPMNLGTYLLPLFLPVFSETYPGIQVQIRENNTSELERLMLAKKIDFCIMHDYGNESQLEYVHFHDDPFYLVVPGRMRAQFDFPKDRKLTAKDLLRLEDAPFIMVANRQKLRLVVDRILEIAGIRPYIRCTTKSMETAKRLVAAGMGVTFLPRSYLTLYSGVEGLESYPIDERLNGSWKLVAAYPKKGNLSRSSREFLRMLKECLEQVEEGECLKERNGR